MKKRRIVSIEWVDSTSVHGWGSDSDSLVPAKCKTVGQLVHKPTTKNQSYAVATSSVEFGDVTDVMVIPKGCVTKFRYIKDVE